MKSSKKVTEYHFIDVNDPERYKKIKVSRACDLCRKRKSKCDLGIPGSGSCSNCKKTNTQCVFSSKSVRQSSIQQFSSQYQEQRPHFSLDNQGLCTFEKEISHYSTMHSTTLPESLGESLPFELELFETYFAFIHPFYPVLDCDKTLETLKTNPDALPPSLKYSILALALQFHPPVENRDLTATAYYHYAYSRLEHAPSLTGVQSLLLMYKYEEIITPVGVPFSVSAIAHLAQAKSMLDKLQADTDPSWSLHSEFVCRAAWVWYINLSFSNLADPRCRDMLSLALPPARLPSLTDTEHYDETSLNITCNFMHLISIAVIYSQTTCYIANHATLFSSTEHSAFSKLASQLQVWSHSLPTQLRPSLFSPPQHTQDPSKTASFALYLGLIHDTLALLLNIHQRPFQGSQMALDLAIKAHRFTLGDLPHPHFSQFASIQGSRLIVYSLTLGFQALSFHHHHHQGGLCEKIDPFTDTALQVLGQISVSSKLALAIQDIKHSPLPEHPKHFAPSLGSAQLAPDQDQPDPAWQLCHWDYPSQAKTQVRYELSSDIQTPPAEQHVSPSIVPNEPFKEPVNPRFVAPMPFDIIDPSFELYPLKSLKSHPSL